MHVDGTTFRNADGTIWKYRMVTAFTAFQDFLDGRDLDEYARWTRSVGGNGWRVFYTWVITGFNPVAQLGSALPRELEAFRRYVNGQGLRLHNTAWCDQVSGSSVLLSRDDRYRLLGSLRDTMQGEFLEAMNEAYQNGGYAMSAEPGPEWFAGCFGMRSAWRDGERPDAPGPILSCTSEHDPRDAEWPRKGKNHLETSIQGMPSLGYTASGKPAIGGEPIAIFETDIPGSRTANADDVADYYAVSELFSAGSCLHGDGTTLQRCNVPGPTAQRCAEFAKAAREAVPAAAQTGEYWRGGLDGGPIEHSDALALRTFGMRVGNHFTVVVVRPQPGWTLKPINGWGVDSVGGPNGHVIRLSR